MYSLLLFNNTFGNSKFFNQSECLKEMERKFTREIYFIGLVTEPILTKSCMRWGVTRYVCPTIFSRIVANPKPPFVFKSFFLRNVQKKNIELRGIRTWIVWSWRRASWSLYHVYVSLEYFITLFCFKLFSGFRTQFKDQRTRRRGSHRKRKSQVQFIWNVYICKLQIYTFVNYKYIHL